MDTPINQAIFATEAWGLLVRVIEKRIDDARRQNDAVGLGIEQTCALRGEIRALARLLRLPEEAAGFKADGSVVY